jgi:PmbA protein
MSMQQNLSDCQNAIDTLKQTCEKVMMLAKKMGATAVAVNANTDAGYSVDVRMNEVETVEFSQDRGVSATIYIGQKKGSASSTDTTEESLTHLVQNAYDIATVSAEDPCFGLAEPELLITENIDLDLYHPWDIEPIQAIDIAKSLEKIALDYDPRIVNSDGVHISNYKFYHYYANSNGANGQICTSRQNISCSLIAEEKKGMQRGYDYSTARRYEQLTPIETLAKQAAERTLSKLNAKKIKTGQYPILFTSRVSSGLFTTFIGAISGSNLYRKNSFLLDSIGLDCFPEFVRIYEQPYLKGGLASSSFDDDGVKTRENMFIDKGKIIQYALGTYSARRMGLLTTANSGGVHNLTIDSTDDSFDSLLAKLGTGLVVTELMGQGVNILTGDYSRGAAGFWVENGKIIHPVEEITIASNLRKMYQDVLAIGNDVNPNIPTKVGSVLIKEMMVAGH